MKLAIGRNELLKSVQSVMGAVSRGKQSLPILTFLHVKSDGEEISLTATDLETTLITRLEHTSEPFETMLPAKRLHDVLRAFQDGSTVGLEEKDGKTTIKCGRSRFVLTTMNPQDFPILTTSEPDYQITVDQALLKSMMSATDYATAKQDVRYYLNGLMVEMSDKLSVVATDGHRLACTAAEIGLPTDRENVVQVILPADAASELKKLLNDEEECEVSFTKNQCRVDMDTSTFVTKLIEGKFPDYRRVIPANPTIKIQINRELLLNAINRVRLVLNDKASGIELVMNDNTLTLIAKSNEENAEEVLDIEYSGGENRIGFNYSYFIDALRVMESENVLLKFTDMQSSVVIEGVDGDDGSLAVIMPMRL